MLQPRVTSRPKGLYTWSLAALLFTILTATSAQDNLEAARVSKDGNDGEITTLVLVQNNNNHPKSGRFYTVTPKLGLISTTERTFIENNVVTKYKSEIVGTTLQNGRLYAQILTKNSQILYDVPTAHTRIYGYQKYRDNGGFKIDDIDQGSVIIKNADYIEPSAVHVHPVFTPPTREISLNNDFLQYYLKNDESPAPVIKKEEPVAQINIATVRANLNLPTYTVKNEFQPDYYYNVDNRNNQIEQPRAPKKVNINKIFDQELKTTTIFGFADFTTKIGDTIIVFTPSTLYEKPNPKLITPTRSFQSTISQDIKVAKTVERIQTLTDFFILPSKASERVEVQPTVITPAPPKEIKEVKESKEMKMIKQLEEKIVKIKPSKYDVTINNRVNLNTPALDMIQPSEMTYSTIHRTHATETLESKIVPQHTVVLDGDLLLSAINKKTEGKSTITTTTEESEEATESTETTEAGTTENLTMTEKEGTTTEEQMMTTTEEQPVTTEKLIVSLCEGNIEPSTVKYTSFKTLTYLTSYFIPLEGSITSTSVKSDVVTTTTIGYSTKCPKHVEATVLVSGVGEDEKKITTTESASETTTEKPTEPPTQKPTEPPTQKPTEPPTQKPTEPPTQKPTEPPTQKPTEPPAEPPTEPPKEKDVLINDPNTQDNEIYTDLIFKTLYTTYTYYTTYFDGPASRISSSKAVISNVVTSTIDPRNIDQNLMNRFNTEKVQPDQIGQIIELVKNKDILESIQTNIETPMLKNEIKEINLIENELIDANAGLKSSNINLKEIRPGKLKTIYTTYTYYTTLFVGDNANLCSRTEVYTNYLDSTGLKPGSTENSNQQTQFDFKNCKNVNKENVTPVIKNAIETTKEISFDNITKDYMFSSDSEMNLKHDYSVNAEITAGETNVKHAASYEQDKPILDDQIISETNLEELTPGQSIIEPSEVPARLVPTYILQTSYTTFTYFTTVYKDDGDSTVRSRLETVTNTVTETLTPEQNKKEEVKMDKITYFTTFTYWTTLFKDKMTVITSRESVISNVISPGTTQSPDVEVINSRPLEVIALETPEIKPSKTQQNKEEKESTVQEKIESDNIIIKNTTEITPKVYTNIEVGLKNPKQDQIENLTFYTTYTYFTTFYIGNSSELRSSLETVTNIVENSKIEDGDNNLARKIQQNDNKNVISDIKATPIDKLPKVEKTASPVVKIDKNRPILTQVAVISGDSVIVDERITEVIETTPKQTNERVENKESATVAPHLESDDSESEDEQNGKKRSRLTFSTKKRTFTPVIRPFASRNRPTFIPKLKLSQSIDGPALTVTRTDLTPTVTATPALKASKGRFSRTKVATNAAPVSKSFNGPKGAAQNTPNAKPGRGFSRSTASPNRNVPASTRNVIKPSASGRFKTFRSPASAAPQIEFEAKEEEKEDETEVTTNVPTTVGFRPRRPAQNRPAYGQARQTSAPRPKTAAAPARATTTTPKPRTTTPNPLYSSRNRQRPGGLFPRRNLFTTSTDNPEVTEETEPENDFTDDNTQEGDYDEEASVIKEVITPATRPVQIRPFAGFRRRARRAVLSGQRIKRQTDYGSRSRLSQFRRPATTPKPVVTQPEYDYYDDEPTSTTTTQKPRTQSRFKPRTPSLPPTQSSTSNSNKSPATISRPSSSTPRQPFVIRGQDSKAATTPRTVSRPRTTRPSTRIGSGSSRLVSNSRITKPKSYSDTSRSSTTRSTRPRTSSRRGHSRHSHTHSHSSKQHNDDDQYRIAGNRLDDGTITVTHKIPHVITVPAAQGKDVKYLTTVKHSTEVLNTDQYSTTIEAGKTVLVLNSESETVLDNGNKVHIHYILNEFPTTGIFFTPTTIRGRKTSYSHIVPSTIYEVEAVSSTIVNQDLNAAVPLANILLSQLLLGQGSFGQNPGLLGQSFQNQPMFQNPGLFGNQMVTTEVVTDLKTRTTTYVTTLNDQKKTVLPVNFRGIEILTTIYDGTTQVITATEVVTDTVLSTNTRYVPVYQNINQNMNQLQQQQQLIQQLLLSQQGNDLGQVLANAIGETPKNEIPDDDYVQEERSSSVVTLYVSGKKPGEFSTVLSTVYGHDLKKRYARVQNIVPLEMTEMAKLGDLMQPSKNGYGLDAHPSKLGETQSLESFFGQLNSDYHLT